MNRLVWGAILLTGIQACGAADGPAADDDGATGTVSSQLGTVLGKRDVHLNTQSAETSITSMHPTTLNMTMAFNQRDPSFVTFNGGTRQVSVGASLMGWTTAGPDGTIVATGRLRPPTNWSVLWGDSAVTRNRAFPDRVYLTNLAIPTSKFSTGQLVGSLVGSVPAHCGSPIGGACIARSSNGGTSFSLASGDCVQRILTQASDGRDCPSGVFYDGSDMETSPEGRVYAAYDDSTRGRIDVYMATSSTGAFQRITDPTPADGSVSSGGHPRLKWGPGGLYLLYASGVNLKLTRYSGGSSRTGSWTAPTTVTALYNASDIVMSDRSIRVGPQYAFDVGKTEGGVDAIRIAFGWRATDGKHHIRIYQCTTGVTIGCANVTSLWDTAGFTPNADQFNPAIAFGARGSDGSPVWMVTYYDRAVSAAGNQVQLSRSIPSMTNFLAQIDRVAIETSQVACPNRRFDSNGNETGGFWGDYDHMRAGPFGVFYRGFTDSSHAACSRAPFNSTPIFSALNMTSVF